MNLWIRSQNREVLTKCHCLVLEEQRGNKWSVLNYDGLEFYQYLGIYDYERALEVLDEIQKFIEEFQSVTAELNEYGEVTNVEHHKKVYEMPKE